MKKNSNIEDDSASRRVLELCDDALQRDDAERDAYLQSACGGDVRLRASVDSVLLAISTAGDFLESGTAGVEPSLIGRRIGNYTLLQKLGQGGMGAVYLASREDVEFEQKVAIKLVRANLMAGELIERFNAERMILAGLHHPYIAGLIDGGTTSEGIPYLVMEYIEGVPIDQYCDDNALPVKERVKLIQKVALAVDAAHRNLVVHRDLKPSNVLVTTDGIPKLLDFGIAKLMQPTSTRNPDHTVVYGRQPVTPDYASPEQMLENTVTTVSDVYSLGVLAYELLVGERPYRIETDSHRAIVKAVEELTVPKPSLRLDTVAPPQLREQIVRRRTTTSAKLRRALRGDLDNILLKALRFDPQRRYGSVAQFSDDLGKYLAGLPVSARADSIAYRLGKFLHRNWLACGAGSVALLSLVIGQLLALQQADVARREADRATKVTSFLEDVLMAPSAIAGAPITSGKSATIEDVIGLAGERVEAAFPDQPEIQAQLFATIAQANRGLGNWDKALGLSERAFALLDDVSERSEVQVTVRLAYALIRFHAPNGDPQVVRPILLDAERYATRNAGIPSRLHAQVMHLLGQTAPSFEAMETSMLTARNEWLASGGAMTDDLVGGVHYKIGQIRLAQGDFDAAEIELAMAVEIFSGDGYRELIDLGFAYEALGLVKAQLGEYEDALENLTRAIAILERSAERNPWVVVTYSYLSEAARLKGDLTQAQRALDTARRLGTELELAEQAPHWTMHAIRQAELDLARGDYTEVVVRLSARLAATSPTTMMARHRAHAGCLIALGHAGLGELTIANDVGRAAFRQLVDFQGDSLSTHQWRERLEAAQINLNP